MLRTSCTEVAWQRGREGSFVQEERVQSVCGSSKPARPRTPARRVTFSIQKSTRDFVFLINSAFKDAPGGSRNSCQSPVKSTVKSLQMNSSLS